METKIENFKEVYGLINSVIYGVFTYICSKHRYYLHDLYKPYFKDWYLFCDDITISFYVTQDTDFYGFCSIPLDVVVNNTWKEYIDSGEWLKERIKEKEIENETID